MTRTMLMTCGVLGSVLAAAAIADSGIGSNAVGRIAGLVSAHGDPMGGMPVQLLDNDHKEIRRTRTDRRGTFGFADLRPAKYLVVVQTQFGRAVIVVEVQGGRTTRTRLDM